jgi:hypothetical protein
MCVFGVDSSGLFWPILFLGLEGRLDVEGPIAGGRLFFFAVLQRRQ